jgi:hypothetical protein
MQHYTTSFWKSPLLGITFEIIEQEFNIYYPDGKPFLSFVELNQTVKNALKMVEQKQKEVEEERRAKEEERKAKEAERKAKEEEIKANEEALAEITRLKAELAQAKKKKK